MSDVNLDSLKREAAAAALTKVKSGQRLGLGTGSTAWHFVDLLGDQVAQGFECICVSTSIKTQEQASSRNIPLTTLDETPQLDVTIDGADEIDPQLNLIKGGGGALLREKIVAAASNEMIVIADETKLVSHLGGFTLPVEVNPFGLNATLTAMAQIPLNQPAQTNEGEGAAPLETSILKLRKNSDGENFVTDGGHFIVDANFGLISDPQSLSNQLLAIAGVVQHGLFLNMCAQAYIATRDGVKRLEK